MSRDWGGRLPAYQPDAARRYRAAGLWGERTIAAEFHEVALRYPRRTAVVSATGRLTYGELDARSDRVAAGLLALGLRPGEPVLFQVTNQVASVLAWYAVLKAGLIPVATLAQHRAHEIGDIAERTGAAAHVVEVGDGHRFDLAAFANEQRREHPAVRVVLTTGGAHPGCIALEDLAAEVDPPAARALVARTQQRIDPDDVAVFQLSGGTTGVPKVIPRRHAEYWYNAHAYAQRLGWDCTSRVAHLIPIIHNAGIVCGLHAPHSVGACLVLGTADIDRSLALLVREQITDLLIGHGHFHAVGFDAMAALAPSLRRAILSGAKVPPSLFDHIEALGVWPGQLFGMAEGFFAVSEANAPREARQATVGTALSPLDEFRIIAPGTEHDLPDGAVGELCCRGPYTLPGYFDAAEHNAIAFTSDGYYRTGDLAAVRVFGRARCLSIEGRIKDVINRGGEKVNAEEIEMLLVMHPGIAEAAVVAMPDDRLGEKACAFLVPSGPPLTLTQVQAHLDDIGVAKFKWPERLEWVATLPRSNINKVDKRALRTRAARLVEPDRHAPAAYSSAAAHSAQIMDPTER